MRVAGVVEADGEESEVVAVAVAVKVKVGGDGCRSFVSAHVDMFHREWDVFDFGLSNGFGLRPREESYAGWGVWAWAAARPGRR
jgi:hypothetical protein